MWWTAAKLLLSGAFEKVLKALSVAWKWIMSDWRNGPLVLLLAFYVITVLITLPALRNQINRVTAERDAERAAHEGTVVAFIAATQQAQREAEANAARVAAEQEDINDEIIRDHRADLAALRARYERLLQSAQAAAADPGRTGAAGLPGLPDTSGRADAAPGEDRLPAAGELSLADALLASEQALQLDALIRWIERQQAVRFTPEPQP